MLGYTTNSVTNNKEYYAAFLENGKLGYFYKIVDENHIVDTLDATQKGSVLDATQGKVLNDKIKELTSSVSNQEIKLKKIDECVKYNSNISGNVITSNPLAFMKKDTTYNYALYTSNGLTGTGCLPDSGKC